MLALTCNGSVSDAACEELDGSNGVVVSRNWEVDPIGIAVGVDDTNDLDPKLLGLGNSNVLLVGVNDEDDARQVLHALDSTQVGLKLVTLTEKTQGLLLGEGFNFRSVIHANLSV